MAQEDFLSDAWLVAFATIIGLIVTIIFNIKASRDNTKARLTELMNQLIQEHYSLYTKEPSLKGEYEILAHAQAYFDLMNRIAYLALNGQIPKDVPIYLKGYYGYVQQWIKYYNSVLRNGFNILKPAEKDWPDIKRWCDKMEIWNPEQEMTKCNFLNTNMEEWRKNRSSS